MTLHTALAAAATLVSVAFALSTFERWLDRRAPHEAAWTAALLFFAAASAALWAGAALGWGPLAFRLFYLFGAVVNVPLLALGSIYLLGGRRWGNPAAVVVGLFCSFAAGVILVAPLTGPITDEALPQGSEVFGPLPRVLAALASSVGALVVFGAAVWSISRRRLVVPNLFIVAGTLILSAGGVLNSVVDEMDAFALSLVAGIGLIFVGFLLAGRNSARLAELPAEDLAGETLR
jgi:hypothetical protein